MRFLGYKVSVVRSLVFVGDTWDYHILIQVSQVIASRLAKGSEVVLIWRVNDEVGNTVVRSDPDVIRSKEAFCIAVALVCRF